MDCGIIDYDTVLSGMWLLTFRKTRVTIFSIQGDVCLSETAASSGGTLHPLPSSEFPVRWCACRSSAWRTVLPEKLPLGQGCWLSEWRSVPLVEAPVTGRGERARHQNSIPGKGSYFTLHHNLQTGCGGQPSLLFSGYRGSFPGDKPGRAADHVPPSSAKFKNGWSCTLPHTSS
jgi:hypothetical protein